MAEKISNSSTSKQSRRKKEPEYLVETLVRKEIEDGSLKYEVKWVGYPADENTMEPIDNLQSCPEKLKDFEIKYRESEETLDLSHFDEDAEKKKKEDLWASGTFVDIVGSNLATDTMTVLWGTGQMTEEPSDKVAGKYPSQFIKFLKSTLYQLNRTD